MLFDCIVSLFSCDCNLYIYTSLREEYTEKFTQIFSTTIFLAFVSYASLDEFPIDDSYFLTI
jgi:hypothetical protein